jgi:hypothetical protein
MTYLFDTEGIDPDLFAERFFIGLALLKRYWPPVYEQARMGLVRGIVDRLKKSIQYGHACVQALLAEEERLKQGNFFDIGDGRSITGIGEIFSILSNHFIRRTVGAEEQIMPLVGYMAKTFILRDTLANSASHPEQLPADLLKKIREFRNDVPFEDIPWMVVNDLVRNNSECISTWYLLNPLAAIVGIEAYCEGAALAYYFFKKEFDSAETANAFRSYYIARRLGDATRADGGAYALAVTQAERFHWSKYSLSDSDRELVEDKYIESFRRVFTDLPLESILNPKLCFGYSLKSAENAVRQWLSKKNDHISIDELNVDLWVAPSDDGLVFVEAEQARIEEKELPAVVKSLPDYDSYLRYQNQGVSLRKLAAEQGRSHETVRKHMKGFESQAKENTRLHKEADLAGWPPISAEVWAQIQSFIPKARNCDCYMMRGIAFKMNKDIAWTKLPRSETFRRYYQEWLQKGVFERMHQAEIELW